jgi:L-threonylcarbamoyladenylate synthase
LVAFPTETVYGLGADARSETAVRRIFEAKQRPAGHPLIVHVSGLSMAKQCAASWGELVDRLARHFWPGPLTLIVPKSTEIPGVVTGGLETVGCRWPDHEVASTLITQAGVPVAAPSANRHKGVSPTSADHVLRSLDGRVDWVVDGGPTAVGIESTVLDMTGDRPVILRPGDVTRRALMAVIGDVVDGIEYGDGLDSDRDPEDARSSPGLAATHYAPAAELVLGGRRSLQRERDQLYHDETGDESAGSAVGWLVLDDADRTMLEAGDEVVTLEATPAAYAKQLYAALHRLDASGVDVILVESPPGSEAWRAVRNRLRRAADRTC